MARTRTRTSSLYVARIARAVGLVIVLASAAWPADGAVLWYEHYANGLRLEEAGAWREAADAFVEAQRVMERPRETIRTYGQEFIFDYDPAFHLARCYVGLALPADAREQLEAAVAAEVTAPAELDRLRQLLEALETEQPPTRGTPVAPASLRLDSNPPAAVVIVDGLLIGTTPLAGLEISAGFHQLVLELPGHLSWSEEIDAGSGEQIYVNVELGPALVDPDESEVRPPGDGRTDGGPPRRRQPAPPQPEVESEDTQEGDETTLDLASGDGERGQAGRRDGVGAAAREGWWALAMVPIVGLLVAPVIAAIWWLLGRLETVSGEGGTVTFDGRLGPLGGRFAGYQVQQEIGRGGMATTYRAYRLADDRQVALKIPHVSGDPTYAERFVREGRLGERLHHPGIVRILEAGEDQGVPYLAMELLPGRTLKKELEDLPGGGGVGMERALEVTRSIAQALDYAHGKGVVHRDLKPENIMILPDGALKVMDFGVARIADQPGLTSSQFFFGSPLYAAPELTRDPRNVDHRADLYSMGILLFELTTGKPPFVHESVFRLLEMHQRQPIPSAGSDSGESPDAIWRMIIRLCEKDPDRRHASAQEVLVDLNQILFEMDPA